MDPITHLNSLPDIQGWEQAFQTAPTQPAKKKASFLQSLLPSLGGLGGGVAGGAAGGALAGSAIFPGVGTAAGGLIGALLGGALGGAGGKVVENKMMGESTFHDVPKEAAIQGALSAGPLRLLKGAGAAGEALLGGGEALAGDAAEQGGGKLVQALNAAGEKAASPGIVARGKDFLTNKGSQIEARAGGFGVGEKVAGSSPLGYYDSRTIGDILKGEGIKAGSPEARLKAVEDALGGYGKQMDSLLGANNAAIDTAGRKAIASDFLRQVDQQPGVNDIVRKSAENLANNFEKQVGDTQSLVDFRRGLDKQVLAFNRNPDAKMAADQLAGRTFRDVLTGATNDLAPGISGVNQSYANLMKAKEFLTGGAKAISDQSQAAGGSVIGRLLTNDTAQAAKSHLGSLMQTVGKGAADTSPFAFRSVAARTLPVGLLGALANTAVPQAVNTSSPNQMTTNQNITANIVDPLSNSNTDLSTGIAGQGVDNSPTATSPFDPSNVEANVQRIVANGGRMKDVQDYVSLVDALQTIQGKAQPSSQKLSATQIGQANNAASGLTDLQDLYQQIQNDPSVLKKASIPGGPLARNLTGTTDFETAKRNVMDVIARMRSGAAISEQEAKNYMAMLPNYADTPQTATTKLTRLYSLLGSFANPNAAAQQDILASGF